jgi:hypothetical protein
VRGHREYIGAFDRIEKLMTPDAEISVHGDTVTVKLAPPGGVGAATVLAGMRLRGNLSLPPIVFPQGPKRVEYVYVEADRCAVEAWIVANALPTSWSIEKVRSPAGRKPVADWDALEDALSLRIKEIGFPLLEHHDKTWRRREDVIRWAQDFLEARKEPAARSTVSGRNDKILRRVMEQRTGVDNLDSVLLNRFQAYRVI